MENSLHSSLKMLRVECLRARPKSKVEESDELERRSILAEQCPITGIRILPNLGRLWFQGQKECVIRICSLSSCQGKGTRLIFPIGGVSMDLEGSDHTRYDEAYETRRRLSLATTGKAQTALVIASIG